MKPVSPVIPGQTSQEVIVAEHQDEYGNLPAVRFADGVLLTRWKLSFRERLSILFKGYFYVWIWTFGRPVQPLAIETAEPSNEEVAQ